MKVGREVVVRLPLRCTSRDDQLRELFDFMAEPNRGDHASARVLCEVVDEWLKVGWGFGP